MMIKHSSLIALASSVVLGWLSYSWVVNMAERDLVDEILSAKAFSANVANDPALSAVFLDVSVDMPESPNVLWRLLVNMNILDWDSQLEEVSECLKEVGNDGFELLDFNGVELLLELLKSVGRDWVDDPDDSKVRESIAECLAEKEGAWSDYDDFLVGAGGANELRLEGLNVGNPKVDLVNRLFFHFGVGEKFNSLPIQGEQYLNFEDYRQVKEVIQNVINNILETPKVSESREWLKKISGWEQCVLMMLFIAGVLLIINDRFNLRRQVNNQVKARDLLMNEKALKWVIDTLPGIGFVGTIHGLSSALGAADSIVRGGSQIESATAVTDVTDTLMLAFSTTLFALVMVIVLELLKLAVSYTTPDTAA